MIDVARKKLLTALTITAGALSGCSGAPPMTADASMTVLADAQSSTAEAHGLALEAAAARAADLAGVARTYQSSQTVLARAEQPVRPSGSPLRRTAPVAAPIPQGTTPAGSGVRANATPATTDGGEPELLNDTCTMCGNSKAPPRSCCKEPALFDASSPKGPALFNASGPKGPALSNASGPEGPEVPTS